MNRGQFGPSGQVPIKEEPVRGFYTDPGQFVALSGLDLLRSMPEGGLGPPGFATCPGSSSPPSRPGRDVYHAGDRTPVAKGPALTTGC